MIDWWRRRRARKAPFPAAWRDLLAARVPYYGGLAGDERARFEDKLKVFALTKRFEGAAGFVVDDTVRVVIAAAAARLSMNLPGEDFQRLREIVVYPTHYKHPEQDGIIFGEAHHHGTVVLSYDAVEHGLANPSDGHDTTLHELAHVLDIADGSFDGTPVLGTFAAYAPWARIMSRHFLALRGKQGARRKSVLRRYGAENEAEFFAVATEAFFEKPHVMKRKHPDLYALLSEYYRADPAG